MNLGPVIEAPDPRLKTVSKPVGKVDASLRKLMDDMLETMYAAEGVGLAAIQVGIPKRLIVMDLARKEEPPKPQFFADPVLLWASDERATCQEGCLSVPDLYEDVERPARVRVRYIGYDGKTVELDADGMLALCLQHEMDHLDGVLFIDHLSKLKRSIMLRKLAKARRQREPA